MSFSSFGGLIHHDLLSTERKRLATGATHKNKGPREVRQRAKKKKKKKPNHKTTTKPKDRTRISSPVVGEAPTHTKTL